MKTAVLKGRMVENNLRDQDMANILGIDVSTFYRKKTGVSDFTREEIKRIKEVLHLSAEEVDAIFFGD